MKYFFSVITLATLFFSCKKTADVAAVQVAEVLKINEDSARILVGAQTTFTLKYINAQAVQTTAPASTVWATDNSAIATVNSQGVVTGVAAGTTNVRASYNNISSTAKVVVAPVFPETLVINEASGTVQVGSTFPFTLKFTNNTGAQAPVPVSTVWSSSNTNIATVSAQGIVTGVAAGQTTIRATYNNIIATSTVTVTAASTQESLRIIQQNVTTDVASGNTTYTLEYKNASGTIAPAPANVVWASTNMNVATINNQGVATLVAAGQTVITASVNGITASSSLTLTNNNLVTSVTLSPANFLEVKLNQTAQLTAVARNASGNTVPSASISWINDNASFTSITNPGVVTANAYGTSNVKASAMGVQSNTVMVQVMRAGEFQGQNSQGMAKLKFENGVLKLFTSSNFGVSNAPDLRIYLTNNANNVTGAVEIATLNIRSGAQSWVVPTNVNITQYRYAMVWCKQFGGNYGRADLNE